MVTGSHLCGATLMVYCQGMESHLARVSSSSSEEV